jgi:hypothetical protein
MRPDWTLIGWTIAGAVAVVLFVVFCDWLSTHAVAKCSGDDEPCEYHLSQGRHFDRAGR